MKTIGIITDYLSKINVIIIELTEELSIENKIKINNTEHKITSMQIYQKNIKKAQPTDSVGIKIYPELTNLKSKSLIGTLIYKTN